MNKHTNRFLVLFLVMIGLLLSGCDFLQGEKEVISIEVDTASIGETYDLDVFQLSDILIIIHYDDDSTESMVLEASMISVEQLALLSQVGTYTFTITYGDKTAECSINLQNIMNRQHDWQNGVTGRKKKIQPFIFIGFLIRKLKII